MPFQAACKIAVRPHFAHPFGTKRFICQMIDEGELSTQALAAAAEALGYTLNPELLDRLIDLLEHSNA